MNGAGSSSQYRLYFIKLFMFEVINRFKKWCHKPCRYTHCKQHYICGISLTNNSTTDMCQSLSFMATHVFFMLNKDNNNETVIKMFQPFFSLGTTSYLYLCISIIPFTTNYMYIKCTTCILHLKHAYTDLYQIYTVKSFQFISNKLHLKGNDSKFGK